MGKVSEVRTTFTIDLAPFVDGLKTMLSMTAATGAQLKPLLTVEAKMPNYKGIEDQLNALSERTKEYLKAQEESTAATGAAVGGEQKHEENTNRSTNAVGRKTESLRHMKRQALESFGAISFLAISMVDLASRTDGGNEKLQKMSQGMSQGVSAGFGLAGILSVLGIASGGVAVAIGAVVTVGVTLLRFFDVGEARAKKMSSAIDGYAESLRGSTRAELEAEYARLELEAARTQDPENKKALLELSKRISAQMTAMTKTDAEARRFTEEAMTDAITNQFEQRRKKAEQTYKQEQDDYKNYNNARTASEAKYRAELVRIKNDEIEFNKGKAKEQEELNKKSFDERVQAYERFTARQVALTQIAGLQQNKTENQINADVIETKKKAAEAELRYIDDLAATKKSVGQKLSAEEIARQQQLETALTQLTADGERVRVQISLDGAEKQKKIDEERKQAIQEIANNFAQATQTILQMTQDSTREQITAERDKKQKALDNEKENLLSHAKTQKEKDKINKDYEAKKEALDKELNEKAKGMNREAFEINKAFSIANALVNTALGVTKALTAAPPPWNFILAASVTALGLAQVAEISAQKVPGMKEGGRLEKGQPGYFEGAENEIVAPERTFVQIIRQEIIPQMMAEPLNRNVILPRLIRQEVLENVAREMARSGGVSAGGGQPAVINNTPVNITINVENYTGSQEHFEKVLKPAVEKAMQDMGARTVNEIFVNRRLKSNEYGG